MITPTEDPIDPGLVDTVTGAIESNDGSSLRRFFSLGALPRPLIVWRPREGEHETVELRALQSYWQSLKGPAALPKQQAIDAVAMRDMLGYIMLIDVIEGGEDFRYRLYGSKIADVSGSDMTGFLVSKAPIEPHLAVFILATYRAVTRKAAPLMTTHYLNPEHRMAKWTRLLLPLSDSSQTVSRILVGCAPM